MRELGVFDAKIDGDSAFFINIKKLRFTHIPDFKDSYGKINKYFENIGILLGASKSKGDRAYREAFRRFNFPEVNGINLGYSSGKSGSGFGIALRRKIIADAKDIIDSGTTRPEIFELIGLFEENVGPDRISDMIARIIAHDIIAYSQRIYTELGITEENFPDYSFKKGIVLNRYKRNIPLLLLPTELLHELPIARCWDDIDRVCNENEAIRKEINELVGSNWRDLTSSGKKKYLREWVFMNPKRLKNILDSYDSFTVDDLDLLLDADYLGDVLLNKYHIAFDGADDSFEATKEILENYRHWLEDCGGANLIQEYDSRKREKAVQKTIHAIAIVYCNLYNWDFSPEIDSGRGPLDFKLSRGADKTVIEVKLSSNQQCVHGLEYQIEEYAKAEKTDKKVFVLVNLGNNDKRVKDVVDKHTEMINCGLSPAEMIILNGQKKDSASKYVPND